MSASCLAPRVQFLLNSLICLRSNALTCVKIPIRAGHAWKIRPKHSHCKKRRMPTSRTYNRLGFYINLFMSLTTSYLFPRLQYPASEYQRSFQLPAGAVCYQCLRQNGSRGNCWNRWSCGTRCAGSQSSAILGTGDKSSGAGPLSWERRSPRMLPGTEWWCFW